MNTTKITALIKLTGLVSWNSLIVIDASSCDQGPGCLLVTWWDTDMSWRFWMNETLIMSLIETDTVSILRGRLWKSLRSQRSKSSRPSQSLGSGRSGKPAALRISPFAQSAHPVTISFHTRLIWPSRPGRQLKLTPSFCFISSIPRTGIECRTWSNWRQPSITSRSVVDASWNSTLIP